MKRPHFLPVGKLKAAYLDRLLSSIPITDRRVLIGPRIGEDAAVIDLGPKCLIATTDPITFASDRIGWYAVTVNANDIAVMGGTPKWFLATLLLPEKRTDAKLAATIFRDILTTCETLNITLCGGHTEITHGLDRPMVIGVMLGEAAKRNLVRKSKIRAGDQIILTKGVAIEGTAILAREKEPSLRKKFHQKWIDRAKNFLFDPGIGVLKDAMIAARTGGITSMHDPTEGGLLAGLHEMAEVGKVGLAIDAQTINIYEETRVLCEAFQIDPLGLIASGALLLSTSGSNSKKVMRGLERAGIASQVIGEVVDAREGRFIWKDGHAKKIRPPAADEITKVLSS